MGCHADDNDAPGLAKELEDPIRREHAISNLQRIYTAALGAAQGDRQAPTVKAIADGIVDPMVKAYIAHPEDSQNGTLMIRLMAEMQDVRTLPALLAALKWRAEVNEEHATTAAETLQHLAIPADKVGEVVTALADALERVTGARGADNRMRIAFINALGKLGDKRATPVLSKVALAQGEEQNFLFNRMAAEQLGRLEDPAAVPTLIKALFMFSPSNPGMRMNDVAGEALVRIGRPSFEPLVALLRGQDKDANAIVAKYIEAIRQRDAQVAAQMSARMLTGAEATFVLGSLGFHDGLAPILEEAKSDDFSRRMNAAIAAVGLELAPADKVQVQTLLLEVYGAGSDWNAKAQLMAVMRQTYDPAFLPAFLTAVKDVENTPAEVRLTAGSAYALLANKAEAAAFTAYLAGAEEDPYREKFDKDNNTAAALAAECDENVECWIKKLSSTDKETLRKASYMLGRLAVGKDAAVNALVPLLDNGQIEVRLAALMAIDHIAVSGSKAAVEKIENMRQTQQGTSSWTNFSRQALPVQARLKNRQG